MDHVDSRKVEQLGSGPTTYAYYDSTYLALLQVIISNQSVEAIWLSGGLSQCNRSREQILNNLQNVTRFAGDKRSSSPFRFRSKGFCNNPPVSNLQDLTANQRPPQERMGRHPRD